MKIPPILGVQNWGYISSDNLRSGGIFAYFFISASICRISSVAAWISPQSCSTSATQLTKSSVLIYSIFRPISENFCPTRPSCSSGKFIHPPFCPFSQIDFTTIIYYLIHWKFCQKVSIFDFEPPNVAVFVAVFFVRLRANKKKSYKSVKFWRWFVGFLELLIRFERTTCSLRAIKGTFNVLCRVVLLSNKLRDAIILFVQCCIVQSR